MIPDFFLAGIANPGKPEDIATVLRTSAVRERPLEAGADEGKPSGAHSNARVCGMQRWVMAALRRQSDQGSMTRV